VWQMDGVLLFVCLSAQIVKFLPFVVKVTVPLTNHESPEVRRETALLFLELGSR
jgi:hypothetical protein